MQSIYTSCCMKYLRLHCSKNIVPAQTCYLFSTLSIAQKANIRTVCKKILTAKNTEHLERNDNPVI